MHALRFREARNDGSQVEITIRDVEGDDASWLHVLAIDRQRFRSEQVHRDRVAGEGVDGEHVELLRRLAFERKTGIAQGSLNGRLAALQIAEILVGNGDDRGVDVV